MLAVKLIINDKSGSRIVNWQVDDKHIENMRCCKILALAEAEMVHRDAYVELLESDYIASDELGYEDLEEI